MDKDDTTHHGRTWQNFVRHVDALFTLQKMDSVDIARAMNSNEPTVCRAIADGRDMRRAA